MHVYEISLSFSILSKKGHFYLFPHEVFSQRLSLNPPYHLYRDFFLWWINSLFISIKVVSIIQCSGEKGLSWPGKSARYSIWNIDSTSSLENVHWPGTTAAQTRHPLVSGIWGALLVAQDHPGWHSRDNTGINQSSGWNSQTSQPVRG